MGSEMCIRDRSIIPGYIYASLSRLKRYDEAENIEYFNKFYVKTKILAKIGYKKYVIN